MAPPQKNQPAVADAGLRPLTTYARGVNSGIFTLKLIFDSIPLEAVFGLGGLAFAGLGFFLPQKTVLAVAAATVAFYPLRVLATQLGLRKNYKMDVVPGVMTATAPGAGEGVGSPEFCVVLLSARSNGPMGFLDPTMMKVADAYLGMMKDLCDNPDGGLLNAETFQSNTRWTSNTLLTVLYFKSAEHCHRWAKVGLHGSVWMEVARNAAAYSQITLSHELFTIKEGGFEGIFVNSDRHGAAELYDEIEHETTGQKIWRSTAKVARNYIDTEPTSASRMAGRKY